MTEEAIFSAALAKSDTALCQATQRHGLTAMTPPD